MTLMATATGMVLAVLAAALVNQVIGFVWYHPRVFGTQWMTLVGKRPEDLNDPKKAIALSAVASLLASVALAALLLLVFDEPTWVEGLGLGALVGVGFFVPVLGTDAAFHSRSFHLYFLTVTYHVVAFLAMGAVAGAIL